MGMRASKSALASLAAGRKPLESEAEFMAQVIKYAHVRGWRHYHTHDSRRSAAGFPDLVFVRRTQIIFAELKSERGKLSYDQRKWLADLEEAGAKVYVWRPSDWSDVERILA